MLPDDWKVQVAGRVSMGSELRLTESIEPRIETSRFVVGLPDDGSLSGMDSFDLLGVPGRLPADRLTWTLMPEDRDIGIEADGLVASYGIFGAPGSGKTYLVMHLFRQLMEIQIDNPDQRFGGLILDPKAGLIGSVTTAMTAVNRSADLTVLSPATVSRPGKGVNIIDCGLDPAELGHLLVLAAQSAGVGASEPYWFGAWKSLFTAALPLLAWYDTTVTTLAGLMDVVLTVEPTGASGASERRIQRIARDARARLDTIDDPGARRDMAATLNQIDGFYRQEPNSVATVETLMTQAYGGFARSAWKGFSEPELNAPGVRRTTFYDQIIDDGRVVLASVGPSEAGMAKVLVTVVKLLFQHTVLSRFERVETGTLCNAVRPVILMCDEYSGVASEVAGEAAGDAYFFSQSRQFGCLGLIATQSVDMLQASSLKENWKAVFSTFGAKVFMRLTDNNSAEEATKLAGEADFNVGSAGRSQQKDGYGSSTNTELRERKALPTAVLTHVLERGQAVVIGSLDGGRHTGMYFLQVSA